MFLIMKIRTFTKNWQQHIYHPIVRDLAWAIFSSSLLDEKSGLNVMTGHFLGIDNDQIELIISHLQKLNNNPAPLLSWLENNPAKKLGDYFEQLIWYWLTNTPGCHKLERSVIVQNHEQTVGEFDFLFFSEKTGSTIHWEVAVKFYLLCGNKDDYANYIGPNPQDTLESKISTFKKQLKLDQKADAKRFLISEQLLPIQSAGLIRGYLFYPLQKDMTVIPTYTSGIHEKHLYGWWDRLDGSLWKKHILNDSARRFIILPRLRRLAPCLFEENDPYFLENARRPDELISSLATQTHQAVMISSLAFDDTLSLWQEVERAVLVPQKWPTT